MYQKKNELNLREINRKGHNEEHELKKINENILGKYNPIKVAKVYENMSKRDITKIEFSSVYDNKFTPKQVNSFIDRDREPQSLNKKINRFSSSMKTNDKRYNNNPLLNVNKQSVDIISLLTNRLTLTEFKNKELEQDLQTKNSMLNEFQKEITEMEELKKSNQKLKDENDRLMKQVEEMQEFLKQYGVSWQEKQGTLDVNGILEELKEKPLFNYSVPQQLDISILSQRIKELNSMLKKEGQVIYKDSQNIHRMRDPDQIELDFYRDGMIIHGFGFMSYEEQKGQQVLADILEGYFPGIMKEQYPEGVIININQKLDQQANSSTDKQQHQNQKCNQHIDVTQNIEEDQIIDYEQDDEYKTVIKVKVGWKARVLLIETNKNQKVAELFSILDRHEYGQKLIQQYPKIEVNRECQLSLAELGWCPRVALILQQ